MNAFPRKISFVDCTEIGQGGPEVCSIVIDGQKLPGRKFDPSYIEFSSKLLAPVRIGGMGYALAVIDIDDLSVRNISNLHSYMKIVGRDDKGIIALIDLKSGTTTVIEIPYLI